MDSHIKYFRFPELSKKISKGRKVFRVGLSDWRTKIVKEVDKDKKEHNKYVEITFLKYCEDVTYKIINTENELVVKYYWDDFDKSDLDFQENCYR